MDSINYLDIKEFREKGYLQEINRLFLHPLGLALEVNQDENGIETLSGIWDYRNEPDGITYGLKTTDHDRINRFTENASFIQKEIKSRIANRNSDDFISGIEIIPVLKKH